MIKQNEISKFFEVTPYFITMIKNGDRDITYKMGRALNSQFPKRSVEEWRKVPYSVFLKHVEILIKQKGLESLGGFKPERE